MAKEVQSPAIYGMYSAVYGSPSQDDFVAIVAKKYFVTANTLTDMFAQIIDDEKTREHYEFIVQEMATRTLTVRSVLEKVIEADESEEKSFNMIYFLSQYHFMMSITTTMNQIFQGATEKPAVPPQTFRLIGDTAIGMVSDMVAWTVMYQKIQITNSIAKGVQPGSDIFFVTPKEAFAAAYEPLKELARDKRKKAEEMHDDKRMQEWEKQMQDGDDEARKKMEDVIKVFAEASAKQGQELFEKHVLSHKVTIENTDEESDKE